MARSIHLSVGPKDGCGSPTKHIGAYIGVELVDFLKTPIDRRCRRCTSGKLFAFVTRQTKVAA